jgi:glucose/arabinose dehydrogenase
MLSIITITVIILNCFIFYNLLVQTAHAQPYETALAQPYINDSALSVAPAVEGLSAPTSMAFLDDKNLLVLEKGGDVHLVSNGVLREQPILKVLVNAEGERGLLGIAISNGTSGSNASDAVTNVFLYYTQADPLRNRVYKYQWNGQSLINPTLILDLPATPGPEHNGGKIIIGPDGYLYAVIGDKDHDGQLQNFANGPSPDDTGVIFRVNPEDGSAASGNPFANSGNKSLSRYYAYGIRNSFGMDFDPLTNNLWDTENGAGSLDEINLVRPGFNSGWERVMGGPSSLWGSGGAIEDELVNFPGSNYSDPVLSWRGTVGPTDLEFFTSSKLGDKYTNNIFVGDINRGNLYFLEVNQSRDGINFNSQQGSGLSDHIVDSKVVKGTAYIIEDELSAITFGSGFAGITDIETGPDGSLYVLSFGEGTVYKISPSVNAMEKADAVHTQRKLTARYTDDPFIATFSVAGVDNDTGLIVTWVTANNVTRGTISNATDLDLVVEPTKDGFIDTSVTLPNGTMHIGDQFRACTIVPKYMYHDCDIGFNDPTPYPESVSVIIPGLNGTANPEHAQRTQTIDDSPFTTMFSIAGVENDTGHIVTWVTANNVTNVFFYNASQNDAIDNRLDGFIETAVTLPNGTMHIGDKYKACTMVPKYMYQDCNIGFNDPTPYPESVSVVIPGLNGTTSPEHAQRADK